MRWSECYICGAEEDAKTNTDDVIVKIFECSSCGEEYCNECGDIKAPYCCARCKEKHRNRLERIDKHFKNITEKDFEANLIKCGIKLSKVQISQQMAISENEDELLLNYNNFCEEGIVNEIML
jgi:hypothetical protein